MPSHLQFSGLHTPFLQQSALHLQLPDEQDLQHDLPLAVHSVLFPFLQHDLFPPANAIVVVPANKSMAAMIKLFFILK
ncbi:MAG: hypothetical protein RL065_1105 [Bacteroidota bacterium]